MITLCGFALSNFCTKVEPVPPEKGIAWVEERVATGQPDECMLRESPLRKVPFSCTARGAPCGSQAIVAWLEATCPEPLPPADPRDATEVRALRVFADLHLELTARESSAHSFFGAAPDDARNERVHRRLDRHLAGFAPLAGA